MVNERHNQDKSQFEVEAARARRIETVQRAFADWMTQTTYDAIVGLLDRWTKRKTELHSTNRASLAQEGEHSAAAQDQATLVEASNKVDEYAGYLRRSHIIPRRMEVDKVEIGNTVVVRVPEQQTEDEIRRDGQKFRNEKFHMVGELDSKIGELSNARHLKQPLAEAIYGRTSGETVEVVVKDSRTKRPLYQYAVDIVQILPGEFDLPKKTPRKRAS